MAYALTAPFARFSNVSYLLELQRTRAALPSGAADTPRRAGSLASEHATAAQRATAMARLLPLLATAAAYVTTPPAKLAPGRTSKRSKVVLGPQSVPQVPYSPPGAEQGQHMYVDIYQALYRDRIMLVGNFLDEEQANSLIA